MEDNRDIMNDINTRVRGKPRYPAIASQPFLAVRLVVPLKSITEGAHNGRKPEAIKIT